MSLARSERSALVDSMRAIGPDAPTLCAGWNNRDLAVHLILRERRPDAAAGMFVGALAAHTAAVTEKCAGKPWDELLLLIAQGPPWYSPFRLVDRYANLAEMFVHHEDVLRGGADPDGPVVPRPLSAELEHALRLPLRTVGRRIIAGSRTRTTLSTPDGREVLTAGSGEAVTVTGTVGELLLFAFGRAPVDVAFAGSAAAVATLRGTGRRL